MEAEVEFLIRVIEWAGIVAIGGGATCRSSGASAARSNRIGCIVNIVAP